MTHCSPTSSLALRLATAAIALAGLVTPAGAQDVLVPRGATWTYLDDGSDQGTAWQPLAFDDSSWASGPAQLGYGDDDELTVVGFGGDEDNKFTTTYFRHEFNVVDPNAYDLVHLRLVADDGAVAYLNGVEVARVRMPGGTITSSTFANDTASGSEEDGTNTFDLAPGSLVAGTNVLAVEVHQIDLDSSDISLDAELLGATQPWVFLGPYLQMATPTSVTIRWRQSLADVGRVNYGLAPGSLTTTVDDTNVVKSHVVTLNGLTPDATYFYDVGTPAGPMVGGDSAHTFTTPPAVGSRAPLRVWVVGDSGTADQLAADVRDAYAALPGSDDTDVWLMLGDNAYDDGTDAEYRDAVFGTYRDRLRTTGLWPTRGNHENNNAYFNVFSMPTAGEAGGMPSGTEAYYSFDLANVHFVCLDSDTSSRDIGGPMWTWLESDLQATTQDWILAFWHHPPYTKGSHDSDTESNLIEMRSNFLPLLEQYGVDLVLNGHSHSYERSMLIDGHHGTSGTLTPAMQLDSGDGDVNGDGLYEKDQSGNAGAVYAVAGSSGKLSDMGPTPHPIMVRSVEVLGSLVLDIEGPRLDARFLTDTGAVIDSFRMEQELDGTWTDLGFGLVGGAGVPTLAGSGALAPDGPFQLDAASLLPGVTAFLVIGFFELNAPFKGGVMVPAPTPPGIVLALPTGAGSFQLPLAWPAAPSGSNVWFQVWTADPAGPVGFSASNALRATSP